MPDRLDMAEGSTRMLQRLFAESGQLDAVSLPRQQLDAQALFQRRQRLAQARLRDADGLGGSSDTARLGDRNQATKLG